MATIGVDAGWGGFGGEGYCGKHLGMLEMRVDACEWVAGEVRVSQRLVVVVESHLVREIWCEVAGIRGSRCNTASRLAGLARSGGLACSFRIDGVVCL